MPGFGRSYSAAMTAAPQYSIVPSADGSRVLMVPHTDGGWSLPSHTHTEARHINAFLRDEYRVIVLLTGSVAEIVADGKVSYVFAHQLREGTEPGGGARFLDATTLADRTVPAEQEAILRDWFAGKARARLSRVAWAQPGWFDQTIGWMTAQAKAIGAEVTGDVEQFLTSAWSCHLRLPTSAGVLHAKAAAAEFGFEAALTRLIHQFAPGSVVPVVAVDEDRHLLLAHDVPLCPNVTASLEHLPTYKQALIRYSEIQKHSLKHRDDFVHIGLPDRRPDALPALYQELLADTEWLFVGGESGLTEAEHAKLTGYAGRFAERCAALAATNLPDTLVNFDFWRGNLEATPTGTIIFDWAECAIGNPLTSLVTVLRDFQARDYPDGPRVRDALVAAYLEQWREYEPPDRLREAMALAEPLGVLCRALCWKTCIGTVDDRNAYQSLRNVVAMNVKRLLPYAD